MPGPVAFDTCFSPRPRSASTDTHEATKRVRYIADGNPCNFECSTMRRPVSPAPRRSQDSGSNTPPLVTQLRRSSSDVAYRRSRFLPILKNVSASSSSTNSGTTSNSNTTVASFSAKVLPSHSRSGSHSALIPSSSPTFATKGTSSCTKVDLVMVSNMVADKKPVLERPRHASSWHPAYTGGTRTSNF